MELKIKPQLREISSRYEVKLLTEEDISDIYALCMGNPTYYQYMKMEPTPENLKEELTSLPPGMTMEDKIFAGFYKEKKLIAILDLISGYPNQKTAYIGWFMVDNEFQGTGIGTEIIEELLYFLKTQHFSYAELGYIQGNKQSEGFWAKNKFKPSGAVSKTDDYTVIVAKKEL